MPEAADPQQLAAAINELPRPWLLGVDVDGTLAPIVARPEMARLAPGAQAALRTLAERVGVMVAVISGRPLADLHGLFEMPDNVILVGSHGAEVGTEVDHRTPDEQEQIENAEARLQTIVDGLPGSWIERKPLAVALHVRQADHDRAEDMLARLEIEFGNDEDLTVHRGHKVLELSVRPVSKHLAFEQLRRRLEPATSIFIGDDESDEQVFASLADPDLSIKVGPEDSVARKRLATPIDVVALLALLAALE